MLAYIFDYGSVTGVSSSMQPNYLLYFGARVFILFPL